MFLTLCLVSFGIYLGQEYQNLPLMKNVLFNMLNYLKTLETSNSTLNSHDESARSTSGPLYVSFFKNIYNYLNFNKSMFKVKNETETQYMDSDYEEYTNENGQTESKKRVFEDVE